jgi:hypothetical protein
MAPEPAHLLVATVTCGRDWVVAPEAIRGISGPEQPGAVLTDQILSQGLQLVRQDTAHGLRRAH